MHVCGCVYLGTWIFLLLTCGRETTARSFPPVSSSASILADLLFVCPLFSRDVAVYHPSGGRCLITQPVLSSVARQAVNLVTDNPQSLCWGRPLLDMPGSHPVPPRLLRSRLGMGGKRGPQVLELG